MSTLQSDSKWLNLLEEFRLAAWGKNPFIKTCQPKPNARTIEYLDFGEHLCAVQSFCDAAHGKLLVFEEYKVAMESFKSEDVTYKNGACIIGQPGIGKTCFIAYAVIERLREKQPVAIQVSWRRGQLQYILFTANCLALHNEDETEPLLAYPRIWTFSDSNDIAFHPNLAFLNIRRNVRIFQTASPAQHRWKEWTKQRQVHMYIMDVPSITEVGDVAFIFEVNIQRMKKLAEKWGPVPRTLLQILETPRAERAIENAVARAVNDATTNPGFILKAIMDDCSAIQGPSTVFFIKPESKADRLVPSVYIPTRWLTSQVVDGLFRRQEDRRAEFFGVMRPHSQARSTLGWMFEAVTHRFLADGNDFIITWRDSSKETLSLGALETFFVITDLKKLTPPYYWCPFTSNFPGIDGAIITPDHVYAVQATMQSKHRLPTMGLNKLRANLPKGKNAWTRFKVLFAGHSDEQAKSLADMYDGRVTNKIRLGVGWLTVPLDSGFQALRQALETNDGVEEAVDEKVTDEEEVTDKEEVAGEEGTDE